MATFSEFREECYRWANVDSDSDADADADEEIEKSYRKHNQEIDELNARLATLQRKLQHGGLRLMTNFITWRESSEGLQP